MLVVMMFVSDSIAHRLAMNDNFIPLNSLQFMNVMKMTQNNLFQWLLGVHVDSYASLDF